MAIVTAIKAKTQSKTAMGKVMAYCVQDKKTRYSDPESGHSYRLISGQNCVAETAFSEFMATKIQHGKDSGVFYKHFVQSFKPNETATAKEIHQMAVELAEYFKGFEVLIATHIDADHWHNHLIVNSVNAETGLKIQFNEHSLNELRKRSDEICKAHGLESLKPYQKESPAAGVSTREYRAAVKGDSWKIKLISAIDMAMEASRTRGDFIANMERMGYGVKWIDHYKYITYTTPEGQKCRDNRLHDEKYLKERMEQHYGFRGIESQESTRQANWRDSKTVADRSPGLRNAAGGIRESAVDDDRNRQTSSAYAGKNRPASDMGSVGGGDSAGSPQSDEQPHAGGGKSQKRFVQGYSISNGQARIDIDESVREQADGVLPVVTSTGQHTEKAEVAASGDWSGNRSGSAAAVLGTAMAIENLLVDNPPKEEQQPKQIIERKNRQKKKQAHGFDCGMEMR
jgi:hypothetical protein